MGGEEEEKTGVSTASALGTKRRRERKRAHQSSHTRSHTVHTVTQRPQCIEFHLDYADMRSIYHVTQ